jgi:hypothetical protein
MDVTFTKEEWREVARLVRPDWGDEEFEKRWEEFADKENNVIRFAEVKLD